MMTSKISNHKDDIGTLKSAGIFIGAVWELARLHDPLLTLLAWYPIGSLSPSTARDSLQD